MSWHIVVISIMYQRFTILLVYSSVCALASVGKLFDETELATAVLLQLLLALDLLFDLGVVETARRVPDDGGETEDNGQHTTGHGNDSCSVASRVSYTTRANEATRTHPWASNPTSEAKDRKVRP